MHGPSSQRTPTEVIGGKQTRRVLGIYTGYIHGQTLQDDEHCASVHCHADDADDPVDRGAEGPAVEEEGNGDEEGSWDGGDEVSFVLCRGCVGWGGFWRSVMMVFAKVVWEGEVCEVGCYCEEAAY